MRWTKVLLPALLLLGGFVSPASAGWVQDGINWVAWPSGDSGGIDCFGNCGAGCSDQIIFGFDAPCGGPQQYWSLSYVAGPNVVATGAADYCVDYGGGEGPWFTETWETYNAIGHWTYHGWVTVGCILHDAACRSRGLTNFWQLLLCPGELFGCGSEAWGDEWSYDQWMVGVKRTSNDYLGWGSCN
jgi:hypothetical protein